MLFNSHKALFWFLRYSNFCDFLLSWNLLRFKKEVENEIIMAPGNALQKLLVVIFGLT